MMNGQKENKKPTSSFLKSEGGKTKSNQIQVPSISLPKGGGAIKGIDEKFSVNAVNGTASFSIPLPFSQARNFSPELSLSYNSGAGNRVFGLGWSLGLSTIKRKTDKELPRYLDDIDSDTYLFSGAEDLVPVLVFNQQSGNWTPEELPDGHLDGAIYKIKRYRPRIEGLFARIERWTQITSGEIKWRVITKENVTTLYGWSDQSRLTDPADSKRIYEWYPEFVFDDKGNCTRYIYKKEDAARFDPSLLHNRNRLRDGKITYTNLYLEKVYYGKKPPSYQKFGDPFPAKDEYLFETLFDYGEYNPNAPYEKTGDWEFRPDAFSEYKAGFEIRTTRRCKRVLLLHHFHDEEYNGLVKSTNFNYDDSSEQGFTFLKSISNWGYCKVGVDNYTSKQLPPLEFEYQKLEWNDNVESVSSENLVHAPSGIDEQQYQFIDLFNEGLSGILTEQANGWYYKHNLGEGRFEQAKLVSPKPSFTRLGNELQLVDLDADGGKQLANLYVEPKGFFELTDEEDWQPFRNFENLPNINLRDSNSRLIDLNGDGKADLLITEDNVFIWYESAGRKGYEQSNKVIMPFDEESGPRVIFADSTQTIFLADMSGDGMTDIVRIRNGEVCYWPNLGYGRFGKKVGMDHSPMFDHPDAFNPSYIRLADIDGSGTTDVIYLGKNKFSCWKNLSGNSFHTESYEMNVFPEIHNNAKVSVTDLLGNGVACIVWSSNLSKDAHAPLKYIDLMGGKKPHIMVSYKNNLGKEVFLEYTPSTHFYLEDKKAGRPWITKLHFPVHCLTRVTVKDKWRASEFSNTYSYHHGYYDHAEREFRGFGRVEQVDVEAFREFKKKNNSSGHVTGDDLLYQPPVKTITWYHTGAFLNREKILSQFSDEYFPKWFEASRPDETNVLGTFRENSLPEPDLESADLSTEEWREALRACKGMMLRQEVYELDVNALEEKKELPVKLFSSAYHNSHINRIQPKEQNKHAVFRVTESENITYHYELDLRQVTVEPDPRIVHTLNLKTDEYGNILQSVSVVYPRILSHTDALLTSENLALISNVQKERHLSYTENLFTDDVNGKDDYRLRLLCENCTYDVTTIFPENGLYFSLDELREYNLGNNYPDEIKIPVSNLEYHEIPNTNTPEKRLVEKIRTLYFNEELDNSEDFKTLNRRAIVYETYKLALTKSLLDAVFEDKLTLEIQSKLSDPAISGYLSGNDKFGNEPDGQYWIPSGIAGFSEDAEHHFCLPDRYTDPFKQTTRLTYKHDLLVESTTDPLENKVTVELFDYRVLLPRVLKDINNNLSEVLFDALGMPVVMALKGKGSEGDNLEGFDEALINPDLDSIIIFFTGEEDEMKHKARLYLANATARYIYYFGEKKDGNSITWENYTSCACDILREKHVSSLNEGEQSDIQLAFEYSDGLGTVLVKKIQAEPDPESGETRWLATGKTILNNKGNPVKQYEPYFCESHCFEESQGHGVTKIIYYDAPGRVVRTIQPDKTYSRVEFSPWFVTEFDQNDTVLEPGNAWYLKNSSAGTTSEARRSASLAAVHANTPHVTILDSLGREVISIEHNRYTDRNQNVVEEKYLTYKKLDAEGKPLWIGDARKNLVTQYIWPAMPDDCMHYAENQVYENKNAYTPCYDIAGNVLFQHSMDAGDRWTLNDAAGKPIYAWDFNQSQGSDHTFIDEYLLYKTRYDALHRPTEQWIRVNENNDQLIERFVYGEQINNSYDLNLHVQLYQHYDQSGLLTHQYYDFKGNLREVQKQLVSDYKALVIDWQENSPTAKLEDESFTKITEYDALNRVSRLFNWHHGTNSRVAVSEPHYNQRGLLESEELVMKATKTDSGPGYIEDDSRNRTMPIRDITYDERGQRQRVRYGNGTTTRFGYDSETFRLLQLRTTRPDNDDLLPTKASGLKDDNVLQNLYYTYDPIGNITQIVDDAYEPVFFKNQIVIPESQYTYDALYRLKSATGRENYQNKAPAQIEPDPFPTQFPISSKVLRNYDQLFAYDSVGNISEMQHVANGGGWTRRYEYLEDSNRLQRTWDGSEYWDDTNAKNKTTYQYDSHGNMLNLANSGPKFYLHWDYRDMISNIDLGGGGFAFYNYDSEKQRSRKVIESSSGNKQWERIYLGGLEIYRSYGDKSEEIESIHLMDGEHRFLLVEDVLETKRDNFEKGILYRYQYSNHLGSAVLELSENANIISYEEYHPYGTTAFHAKNEEINVVGKRYRYTGKERDEESGFDYYEARYYIPSIGRWCSPDPTIVQENITVTPISDREFANLYIYSLDNPIVLSDPAGLSVALGYSGGEKWTPLEESQPQLTQEMADIQLKAIKEYLRAVGKIQGQHLGLTGKSLERFMEAEAASLSLKQEKGRYLLHVDPQRARRGHDNISWVLQRIIDLEKSAEIVRVVFAPTLLSTHGTPFGETYPKDDKFNPFLTVGTRTRPLDINYRERPLVSLGRTTVHELVIHAWRNVNFAQPGIPTFTFAESGHYELHYKRKTKDPMFDPHREHGPHNWADVEAHLLSYYELEYSFNLAQILYIGKGRPPLDERRNIYKQDLAIIPYAGGVMGRKLLELRQRYLIQRRQ